MFYFKKILQKKNYVAQCVIQKLSSSHTTTKKLLLYDFEEAFEIDLRHEFQLYTFARSSSDNFSPTRKSNTSSSASVDSFIFIFFPYTPSFSPLLIDFSPPGSHYLLNITVGIQILARYGMHECRTHKAKTIKNRP